MNILQTDAKTIAAWVGGRLLGGNCAISGVGTLQAGTVNDIGFLADSKYKAQLADSRLGAILLSEQADIQNSQIVVEDVRKAWRIITEKFADARPKPQAGIAAGAIVDGSAAVGEGASIGAGAVVDTGAVLGAGVIVEPLAYIGAGATIGDYTRIGAGAKILAGTRIGARCNILANAVIGERGFGNSFEDGRWLALPQLGGVQIGDDVEIGAGTMIDRGAVGDTIIRDGAKLDNLIQVAHNVEIGEHTAIAGCCVIAGSVKFGKYCIVGGASVFAGHITICDGAHFAGHSSVSKSVTKPGLYCSALTIMPDRDWKRFVAKLRLFGREK